MNKKSALVFSLCVLCASVVFLSGCRSFEVVTGADGQPHTRIETALDTAGKVVGGVSGFVPVPGAGIIGGGLAAILGLIGHSITSVVVSRRRQDALSTVIKGVEVGSDNYAELRDTIVGMLGGDAALQQRVKNAFEKATSVKEIIANISSLVGNAKYLDSKVQDVTAKIV